MLGTFELFVRYTKKIGVLDPNFAKIGDESTNMKMRKISTRYNVMDGEIVRWRKPI
jgi:hypothetical protein